MVVGTPEKMISDIVRKTRRTNRQNVSGEEEEVRVVLGFSINAMVLLLLLSRAGQDDKKLIPAVKKVSKFI